MAILFILSPLLLFPLYLSLILRREKIKVESWKNNTFSPHLSLLLIHNLGGALSSFGKGNARRKITILELEGSTLEGWVGSHTRACGLAIRQVILTWGPSPCSQGVGKSPKLRYYTNLHTKQDKRKIVFLILCLKENRQNCHVRVGWRTWDLIC